jgi:alpha-L-fucosidase 2
VKGLVARGGFVLDSMTWNGGQVQEAVITSRLGGKLRLRSYVPLTGEGLKEATGVNDNPFYAAPTIATPLVSKEISAQQPMLLRTYEYDVDTEAGRTYTIRRK